MDSRRAELVFSRSGEINPHLTAIASVHVLRERWAYTGDLENPGYRYGSFAFPELAAEYADVDDRLYPRAGLAGSLRLRAAPRSEEHTSELQSLMRLSYAVFCLKKK